MAKLKEIDCAPPVFGGEPALMEYDQKEATWKRWCDLKEEDGPRLKALASSLLECDRLSEKIALSVAFAIETFPNAKQEQLGAVGSLVEKKLSELTGWAKNPTSVSDHMPDLAVGLNGTELKVTTNHNGWMIPRESKEGDALLVLVNRDEMMCSYGVIVLREEYLRPSENRDGKRNLLAQACSERLVWLAKGIPIPTIGLTQCIDEHWAKVKKAKL